MSLDLQTPAHVERAPAWLDGRPSTRLFFIFRAIGCAYARAKDGGCTNCGFIAQSTHGVPVPDADLIAQFETLFLDPATLDGVEEVDLYNSGSFLADQEIPPAVRAHVMRRLGALGAVRRVLIESRPEHVRADKLAVLRALLGERQLEVGVGLESSDDRVREVLVHKGFGRRDFEDAVAVLGVTGARLLAYVLLKPLRLTEREAIEDSVATSRYVFEVAREHGVPARIALEPVFVAPGTSLEQEFGAGRYQPPSLWSAVEVVRRVHPHGEVLVGLSDEGLEPRRVASGCPRCTPALRSSLAEYNRTRNLTVFAGLACECQAGRADPSGV